MLVPCWVLLGCLGGSKVIFWYYVDLCCFSYVDICWNLIYVKPPNCFNTATSGEELPPRRGRKYTSESNGPKMTPTRYNNHCGLLSLKMDGWKTTFLLGYDLLSGAFALSLGRVILDINHQSIINYYVLHLSRCVVFFKKIHPWKLSWNLKKHQIEQENHLPHLHFCVQNVNFPGNVTSPAIRAAWTPHPHQNHQQNLEPKLFLFARCSRTLAINPVNSPVEVVGSLSHYLQGFSTIPGGWEWDFWTTNSSERIDAVAQLPSSVGEQSNERIDTPRRGLGVAIAIDPFQVV